MYRLFYSIENEIYFDKKAFFAMARNFGVPTNNFESLLSSGPGGLKLNANLIRV